LYAPGAPGVVGGPPERTPGGAGGRARGWLDGSGAGADSHAQQAASRM